MNLFRAKQIIGYLIKHLKNNKISILIVYVDVIILIGDDEPGLIDLKQKVACEFQIKDMGTLKYFQGMKFARSNKRILLTKENMSLTYSKKQHYSCKVVETLIEPNLNLLAAKEEEIKDKE